MSPRCIVCLSPEPAMFGVHTKHGLVALVFCCTTCKDDAVEWALDTLKLAKTHCDYVLAELRVDPTNCVHVREIVEGEQ